MEHLPETRIVVDPTMTPDQLFDFYVRNNICEVGYGKQTATRILDHPHVIVAAFAGQELVGLARATFDGLCAAVMEFSLDLRWQGSTPHANGSLVEADPHGLGAELGRGLLDELDRRGSTFVTAYIVQGSEDAFYSSVGFIENSVHVVYYIDQRPYRASLRTIGPRDGTTVD